MRSGTPRERPDRFSATASLLLFLWLATSSAPADAQQAAPDCAPVESGPERAIRTGSCVSSTIDASDPRTDYEVHYEDWQLPLAAGESVRIDLDALAPQTTTVADGSESVPFDPYLELWSPGTAQRVAANDDRPGSTNSTLLFTAPEAGVYVVRARPLLGGTGDYSLRVATPPPPPVAVALVPGRNEVRPPEAGGESLQDRLFTFEGRRGERVRLTLERRGFGDQLRLVDPDGQPLASAGELDPSVSVFAVLPKDGRYRVEAKLHAFGPAGTPPGLDFEKVAAPAERPPQPVQAGASVDGEINLQSPAAEDAYGGGTLTLHELYELPASPGQTVTVTLTSNAFDPVLDAGAMSAVGFATAITDDDGGGGTNSRLVLRPERPGQIVLRVRALGNGIGAFQLRVLAGDAPAPSP